MRQRHSLILLIALVARSVSSPAAVNDFRNTPTRYLSGHDLQRVLRQKFPHAKPDKGDNCHYLDVRNRALLGDAQPATGEVPYAGPSPAYVRWYSRCLLSLAQKELEYAQNAPNGFESLLGADAVARARARGQTAVLRDPQSVAWKTLATDVQQAIALQIVREFLGPGTLKDEGAYATQLLDAAARAGKPLTAFTALRKMIFFVGMQDGFLTY